MQNDILSPMIKGKVKNMIAPSITDKDRRLQGKILCKNCLNSKYLKTKTMCKILGEIKYPNWYFCSWYGVEVK